MLPPQSAAALEAIIVQTKQPACLALAVALPMIVVACGGGGTPAAPTSVVQSIAITSSSDLLFIGASELFTAAATMSGGGTQPVTGGVWGSDTSAVASVGLFSRSLVR